MPPTFCRHNRFVQNCAICRAPEPPKATRTRPARAAASASSASRGGATRRPARSSAVRVRQLAQAADDGYRSQLVSGLKASADAERLADELAFAQARLAQLEGDPPGIYDQIALEDDAEEALWLAFLTAWLCPLEDEPDPFAAIRAAHVPWASAELPRLDVAHGPRGAADPAAGERAILSYRAWAQRAGSQRAAYTGELQWTPERRFDRVYERLALPGLGRAARYELLVSVGRLGLVDLRPSSLQLGDDATALAAKRVFGIGDTILIERRARALAAAAELPIEALDLALFNWGARGGVRATYGSAAVVDEAERAAIGGVLGV